MQLTGLSVTELEQLYRREPLGVMPRGCFVGRLLRYVESAGARRPLVRGLDWLFFEAPRFGVDFDRRRWWFIHPALGAGRFLATPGRSRWRDTETLKLSYAPSRLPIRGLLYDEIKPLGDALCLGIGGLNFDRGEGDHFFFELRLID
jgi:hypothetical protein